MTLPSISRLLPPAALLTLSSFLATGCTGESGGRELTLRITPLEMPAGEGSGEPNLARHGERVILSWLQAAPEGGHDLWVSLGNGGAWSEPRHVAYGDDFFVNWADFPSVRGSAGGRLWAHWLQRGAAGGMDYGIRISHSDDDGRSWSEPWTPHEDESPTEHGFVTLLPVPPSAVSEGGESSSAPARMAALWLDGRKYAPAEDGTPPAREMTLRARFFTPQNRGTEMVVDARTCDCCQTDAALTPSGPVVVYRDRTEDEVRDIYLSRFEDGTWTEGHPVFEDGWVIGGCPVNGPAVTAWGDSVAVAWFSAPDNQPRVQVAVSGDAGDTFALPVRVDGGAPAGRVDLVRMADGHLLVSWMERVGEEGAYLRVARLDSQGAFRGAGTVTSTSASRSAGFPRMVPLPGGGVLIAWTDVSDPSAPRIHGAIVEVPS